MKKILISLLFVFSLGITACSKKVDFDTYVSDVMYMYDDVERSVDAFSHFQSLEELLVIYSDLSVRLETARSVLDNIGRYGSDKFLYNSAYTYLDDIQKLYQNDLHKFVMHYAKDKKMTDYTNQQLAQIIHRLEDYDIRFEKDLEMFMNKYQKDVQ